MSYENAQLPLVPGLDRGEVHYYGEAEYGWSVPYSTPELTATVYVYPYPPREPEDRNASLSDHFDEMVAGMAEVSTSHGYEVVSLDKSPGRVDPTRLDSSARHGFFLLRGSSETGLASVFTEILLAIAGDEFLKVRCTYTSEKPKRTGAAINSLLAALRSAFWPV